MAKGDFKNLPVHRIVFSVDTVYTCSCCTETLTFQIADKV